MIFIDELLGFGLPFVILGGVVLLVRRMLRRHKLTEKELRQLELDQQNSVQAMMLPTLTTEGTRRIGRDPEFELDAEVVRMKGLSGM